MGWWLLDDCGGIKDFDDGRELQNALPGKDSSELRYGGDGPADIMGPAVDAITKEYESSWDRQPTRTELIGCLDFVCGPKKLAA